jgi:hypothetical protein
MEPFDYFEELNKCRYLFLKKLIEPGRHILQIQVIEGRLSKTTVPVRIAGKLFGEGHSVEIEADSGMYELTWNSYVLYQVTNEMFFRKEPSVNGILGLSASVYRSSELLDFVARASNASDNASGSRLLHFRIACEDHIIDVISEDPPKCQKTSPKPHIH